MYLKSLEISGFKSFAKKSQLDFKTAVTAIVGPNGSGKSNVAEAFRFVLGEQSLKSMRGKKGEDMIWNGSPEQARANRAQVKAVFDNSKKIFNMDFDEISVERAVNRDGSNEYSINGSQVRLRDVLELLAQAHIGSSGHHIISQGEADRILSANIKERKAMIEDALGLKVYQYKRAESAKKMEKTLENLNQVESLRREIAPHLKFLKKQVEKMGKATEVKEKLVGLYREYLKREKVFVDNEKENLKNEKKPLEEKSHKLKGEMEKAREVLKKSEKKDGKSEELLKIESEIREEREEKDKLGRDVGRLEGEIEASERLIEKTEKKIESGGNVTVALREIENLAEEIEKEQEISEIKKKIREFLDSKRTPSEEGVLNELRETVQNLKKKYQEIEEKIKEKENKLHELDSSYRRIREEIEGEKDQSREAEKEMMKLSSEETILRSELEILAGKEERLKMIELDFLREVEEAGVLLGSAITGFDNLEIDRFEIIKEERKTQEERRRELERMKIRLEEFGAAGGEDVMKEFQESSERDAFLERELGDLNTSIEALNKMIEELEERLNTEFESGIDKINKEFHKFFSLMFGGGTAELQVQKAKNKIQKLGDDLDPEDLEEKEEESEEGIEINVSLPKKRVKGLQMLSGGERALVSIALLFAMSAVNPPPFIILDETDAALDEANSKKYGDMIEQLSKYSQLILITHNRETMSRAGVIYGVTMGASGVSKLLSIEFDEAVVVAK